VFIVPFVTFSATGTMRRGKPGHLYHTNR